MCGGLAFTPNLRVVFSRTHSHLTSPHPTSPPLPFLLGCSPGPVRAANPPTFFLRSYNHLERQLPLLRADCEVIPERSSKGARGVLSSCRTTNELHVFLLMHRPIATERRSFLPRDVPTHSKNIPQGRQAGRQVALTKSCSR